MFMLLIFLVSSFWFKAGNVDAAPNYPASSMETIKAGFVPGDLFYFFDNYSEKINLLFTFSKSKRFIKKINYGEERLAEMEKLITADKLQRLELLVGKYQKLAEFVAGYIKNTKNEKEAAEIKKALLEKLVIHRQIINKILAALPEEQKGNFTKIVAMFLEAIKEGTPAPSAVAVDYLSEAEFPEVLRAGMDVSQWGPTYLQPYYRNKFHAENNPGLYRTGLVLRSYVSEEAENFDDYFLKLKNIDETILSYKKAGADVIFTIYGMPKFLSSKCEKNGSNYECSENWGIAPPRDYNEWANLVEGVVRHYKNELGIDLLYEVWNEADQNYVFKNDDFWTATEEEYLRLYKYSFNGAVKADPQVKIGGPGSSVWNHDVVKDFLKYADKEDLRVSFVTWHMYVGWNDFRGSKNEIIEISQSLKDWLDESGFDQNTPLILDEFNYDPGLQKPLEHETEFTASYYVYALENMIGSIDRQTFFHFNDFQNSELFAGDPGAISRDGVIKPVYNAMRMMSLLGGKAENQTPFLLNAAKSDDSISALASKTRDGEKVRVLLSYFVPEINKAKFYELFGSTENKKEVSLEIENIPFSGSARMTAHVIDKDNSNACRYNKKTEPAKGNAECGLSGEIELAVRKANQDSQAAALAEVRNYLRNFYAENQINTIEKAARLCAGQADKKSCLKDQIKRLCAPAGLNCADVGDKVISDVVGIYSKTRDSLFYYGNRSGFSVGARPEISEFINKINNNPRVSLEGSKRETKIEVSKDGTFKTTLEMSPYSVILLELGK